MTDTTPVWGTCGQFPEKRIAPNRQSGGKIGLQRPSRRHASPVRVPGFDDGPRAVADRRYWLAIGEEGSREGNRGGLHTQRVGIDDAAWQHQRVEIVGPPSLCITPSTERRA
jgi:hypothetical protein